MLVIGLHERLSVTKEQLGRLILVASVPSRSDKGKTYEVKQDPLTQEISCSCPGWVYSKREPRSCRHSIVFDAVASVLVDKTKVVSPDKPFRKLTNAEVDSRNFEELGTSRPTDAPPLTVGRKSINKKLPKDQVAQAVEIRTTIRTITFEEDDE